MASALGGNPGRSAARAYACSGGGAAASADRTTTHHERGLAAITKLNEALHAMQERLFMEPGDIICIDNNACIHSREVIEIKDKEATSDAGCSRPGMSTGLSPTASTCCPTGATW